MRTLAAGALLALALTPAALADASTHADVQRLAAQAADGDAGALAQLRRIDSVDGRPADLAAALDAEGAALQARLRTLAAGTPTGGGQAADARRQADRILSQPRFHGSRVPRPFHGVLAWIGDKLRVLARPFNWLADRVPGGPATLWLVIAGLVVAAAAVVATRLAARRGGLLTERHAGGRRGSLPDPGRLEREAAEAERRGDLELALRLRFRAGLLRLTGADVIPSRDSLTSGQLRRLVGSPRFDRLAGDLDEVVYGGRPAAAGDVERAREAWPRVLQEARRP